MKSLPNSAKKLIQEFSNLPGIGRKTAQRLTFYILQIEKEKVEIENGKPVTVSTQVFTGDGTFKLPEQKEEVKEVEQVEVKPVNYFQVNKRPEPKVEETDVNSIAQAMSGLIKKPEKQIEPGDEGQIEVNYDTSRVGIFRKAVTVNSNAKTATVILRIMGEVLEEEEEDKGQVN